MCRLRRRVLLRAGAGVGLVINTPLARFRKKCFRKDSQVRNACIFASFRKYAFTEIQFKYLGFASFCKYAGFRKLSCKFPNVVSQCFARIRKLSHFIVLQALARFSKNLQMDFCKEMDFSKDWQVRKSWFLAKDLQRALCSVC